MELFLEPQAWLVVVLFSVLGVIGNLALYKVGEQGVDAVRSRFPRIKPEQWDRARELYEERGSWILLLSAVPVLGIILTTAAGAFGVGLAAFILWVMIGKLVRNWALVVIVVELLRLLQR
jgi:membrane protein YqaA with SNARE-associated domain